MDEQTKDWVNIDANEAFADPTSTWKNVLQQHKDAGYTNSQIANKFDNSRWSDPTTQYSKWRAQLQADINAQDVQRNADIDASINERQLNEIPEASSAEIDSLNDGYNTLQKVDDNGEYESEGDYKDRRKKELRDQYSTDNATFKKMAQEEGIEFAAKSAMKTPMQAYLNGDISKSERDYLIFDAISTAMSNAGNTLLNIAAAYTGGSGNFDTNQKSMWANRMAGVNDANTSALQRGVEGSTQEMEKKLSEQDLRAKGNENRKVEYQLLPAEAMAKVAQNESNPGWLKGLAMSLTADFAGNDQDLKDTIVNVLANSHKEISEAAAKENIPVIEYMTRELGKLGAGFTSDIVGGLAASVGELTAAPLGAAQDKANELVYGEKKEANVDSVTPEMSEMMSRALKAGGLGILDEDSANAILDNYKKTHPGRGLNLNELAVSTAVYKARKMGAKISEDDAVNWEAKARKVSNPEELAKLCAKIGKKVPKAKY